MTATSSFPLPIGGVVGTAFSVYLRNLPMLFALTAIVHLPWIVLRLWLATDPRDLTLALLTLGAQLGLGQVLSGAVTYAVVQHMTGNRIALPQAIVIGVRSFLPVVVTGLVSWLVILLGAFLCALAAGMQSVPLAILGLVALVPGIFVMVLLYPAIPVCVAERAGVGRSLSRALSLTKGSRWQIFGAIVLMGVVAILVFALPAAIVVMAVGPAGEEPAWFDILRNLLMSPFLALFPAVVYSMLRRGKENLDVQQLAAVFA